MSCLQTVNLFVFSDFGNGIVFHASRARLTAWWIGVKWIKILGFERFIFGERFFGIESDFRNKDRRQMLQTPRSKVDERPSCYKQFAKCTSRSYSLSAASIFGSVCVHWDCVHGGTSGFKIDNTTLTRGKFRSSTLAEIECKHQRLGAYWVNGFPGKIRNCIALPRNLSLRLNCSEHTSER